MLQQFNSNSDPSPEGPNFTGCPLVKGSGPLTLEMPSAPHLQLAPKISARMQQERRGKALHWCYLCSLQQRAGQQPAAAQAAHLVVLLKDPLQELVAQVVELRGAAGGNTEPVAKDPSESPQALNEGQRVGGSLANPGLTWSTQLPSPSLLKASS